jgi:enoyl-CoA hydratase/carnithine racemase
VTATGYEALELQIADHVANVRLTRPEVLKRFDETLHREFADVLNRLNGDPEVRFARYF